MHDTQGHEVDAIGPCGDRNVLGWQVSAEEDDTASRRRGGGRDQQSSQVVSLAGGCGDQDSRSAGPLVLHCLHGFGDRYSKDGRCRVFVCDAQPTIRPHFSDLFHQRRENSVDDIRGRKEKHRSMESPPQACAVQRQYRLSSSPKEVSFIAGFPCTCRYGIGALIGVLKDHGRKLIKGKASDLSYRSAGARD